MEEVLGWFGEGGVHLLAGALLLAVVAAFLRDGGLIYEAVYSFMTSICG